jgi:hypothetical protein
VFLVTNSLWDYTHVVMNHICGFSHESERNLEWLKLFDLVIVGALSYAYALTYADVCVC